VGIAGAVDRPVVRAPARMASDHRVLVVMVPVEMKRAVAARVTEVVDSGRIAVGARSMIDVVHDGMADLPGLN
jgi:hypothetical protein